MDIRYARTNTYSVILENTLQSTTFHHVFTTIQ